jgi:hypothetical protein
LKCGAAAAASLSALLKDGSRDVATNACISLRHLSELPALIAVVVRALVDELPLLQTVYDGTSLPYVQSLSDVLTEAQAAAGMVLQRHCSCNFVHPMSLVGEPTVTSRALSLLLAMPLLCG